MRKRGRFGSLLCATIAGMMAALIDAAGFGASKPAARNTNPTVRTTPMAARRMAVPPWCSGKRDKHACW